MIWLLDTNSLINFSNRAPGHERIARRMSGKSPGELRMSAISLSELEWGIANSKHQVENRAVLDDLLSLVRVDDYPAGAALHFGELRVALERMGRRTEAFDLLIGAHARALDAVLVTSNTDDFKHMPGLRLANWLKP